MKAHEVICYVSLGPQKMDLCHSLGLTERRKEEEY